MLRALAFLAPPIWSMKIAALGLAASTIFVVMLRAPFSTIERAGICLGYLLLIEYGSIARSYSLGVALMFLFIAARSSIAQWAILAVLPFIEIQFAVLSIAGAAMLWHDRRWSWAGAALLVISLMAMVVLIWPAPDIRLASALDPEFWQRPIVFMATFANLMLPLPMLDGALDWMGQPLGIYSLVLGPLFILLGLHQLRGEPWSQLVFLGFCGFTAMMALFVYPMSIRHSGLCAILLIVLAWRTVGGGGDLTTAFRAWIATSAISGLIVAGHIANVGFDSSRRIADFMTANRLLDGHIVAFDDSLSLPVAAALHRPSLSIFKGCRQTFLRLDANLLGSKPVSPGMALGSVIEKFGRIYLITNFAIETAPTFVTVVPLVDRVAMFPKSFSGPPRYLYTSSTHSPEIGEQPPWCPPLDPEGPRR